MYYKVYLILAHKKPQQLNTLISLLNDGKSFFFIHLDKKSTINNYEYIAKIKNCFFVKLRVRCNWGDYSLVQATLNSFAEVVHIMNTQHPNANYHVIMLSGEDLPLKSNNEIHSFLSNQKSSSFIHHWKLPYKNWWGGGMFRFESFYYFNFLKYPKAHKWMNLIIKKVGMHSIIPNDKLKRNFPNLPIYGSSQWMILSKELVQEVLQFSVANHKFNAVFKYVFAPDELYFATLIYNLENKRNFLIENVQTHLALFHRFDANPKYVSVEDIQKHSTDTSLFARKFDLKVNSESMSYIINKRNK